MAQPVRHALFRDESGGLVLSEFGVGKTKTESNSLLPLIHFPYKYLILLLQSFYTLSPMIKHKNSNKRCHDSPLYHPQ